MKQTTVCTLHIDRNFQQYRAVTLRQHGFPVLSCVRTYFTFSFKSVLTRTRNTKMGFFTVIPFNLCMVLVFCLVAKSELYTLTWWGPHQVNNQVNNLPLVSWSWKLGSMPLASACDTFATLPDRTQCRNFFWCTYNTPA